MAVEAAPGLAAPEWPAKVRAAVRAAMRGPSSKMPSKTCFAAPSSRLPAPRSARSARDRPSAARNRRMFLQAEQFLHADVQRGGPRAFVIERMAVACRGLKVRRGFGVEALPHRPRKQRGERLLQRRPVDFRNTCLAGQIGKQPLRDAIGKCSVR